MGTIPKTRSTKSVTSSCGSRTACPSMRSGSISAYGRSRSSRNVGTRGGASEQSEVSEHLCLQIKALQSELLEAKRIIEELKRENRTLRTLQKRQEVGLSTFQSENADLPQLLNSHAAELRVWKTKSQNLQKMYKDLEQKLKKKEAIILTLNDQKDHYIKLNKDRNLEERECLTKKLEQMELKLKERDDTIKHLERKLLVEEKSSKQQLREQQKNATAKKVQLGEALVHIKANEKSNDLSDNPVGKPRKTPRSRPKNESEEKERYKCDLDCSKLGIRYSKSVGSPISKPSSNSSTVVSTAKKLGSTRANNSAPSNKAGYMQPKQLPQKQQQRKPPQQREPQKLCKPLQGKAKDLKPENMAVEENLTATSDPDSNEFKGVDLGYTNTRDGRKTDEESVEKGSKLHEYISYLEELYDDEDDLDDNDIDNDLNDFDKNFITNQEVSKEDVLCDIYTKFCENTEIGDAIKETRCGRGPTGRKFKNYLLRF